jgi:signal transduction histidine kinase
VSARSFLTTSTFRLSMLYAALFSLSVLVLGSFVYGAVDLLVERQREQTVRAEFEGLAGELRSRGLSGLIRAIQSRLSPGRVGDGIYLLIDGLGQPLAGNLTGWPARVERDGSWLVFPIEQRGVDRARVNQVYALEFLLPGGFRMLVGQNTHSSAKVLDTILDAFLLGVVAMLLLAIGGGLLFSRRLLNRVEAINRGAERVRQGDVGYRMPVGRGDDEFDRLGANLNAMLDEIERLMKAIRAVTDNIAHDLRSPLTRLRNRLEAIDGDNAEPAAQRQAIRSAIDEADQVLETFRALLSIADAESGAALSGRERVELAAIATDVAELYEPVAEEQGRAIDRRIVGVGAVSGSRQLLFQVTANLLDNAVKYGRGAIGVAIEEDGDVVRLIVGDHGPGIAPEDRERVLERFVRLDASRSTPGTGLGLSLVAAIARLHGGTLTLEDNLPGLRAVVSLPAARPGDASATP